MTRDEKAAQNRARMPTVAAWVDEYAQWGAKVIYASEGGHQVGKQPDEVNVFTVPAGYNPCYQIPDKKEAIRALAKGGMALEPVKAKG